MTKLVAISFVLFASLLGESPHALAADEVDASVRIERDEDLGKTRMEFVLSDGVISWTQVFAAFARRKGFNELALPGFSGGVNVSGLRGRFSLVALNLVLSPLLRFSVSEDGDSLLVTVDDLALLSTTRRLKELLRERERAGRFGRVRLTGSSSMRTGEKIGGRCRSSLPCMGSRRREKSSIRF